MTTTSAIHARTTTADPGITLTATKVTTTGSRISRTSRRKVKDFNDSITCSLCRGYLIEATTINDCLHTFCRSCIVRHLEGNKYCPKCKSYNNKTITVANLRPDRILRSLVYKLVPGLHKSENQRAARYYADQGQDEQPPGGSRKAPDHSYLDDQNFFSPDELINLSLEYHYDSIVDYDPKKQELPITYLCCPAAVTIHHLYKFILTKNGLQLDNERIQVDIIYEDEILPHEFTLMDVAYCFNYKRSSLMRLYYRIFIHPTAKPTATTTTYNVGSDKNSNENNKYSGGERDANNSTGRSSGANFNEPSQGSAAESSSSSSPSKPTSTSPSKNATAASSSDAGDKVSTAESKEADSQIKVGAVQDAAKSVNNEASKVSTEPSVKSSFQPTEASCYSKYDSKLIITKTNKSDKGGSEKKEKESLKLVLVPKKSDKNDAKIVYSKSDSKPSKSPKQSSPSAPVSFGDFKRLRSNDIRYSDYETSSSSSGVGLSSTKSVATSSNKSGTVPGNDSKKTESQNAKKYNKINNDYNNPSDSSGKKVSEDNSRNKVYGNGATNNQREGEFAPAQQVCVAKTKHEKSKPSPPRSENNGAPMAITASTTSAAAVGEKSEKSSELKCYVNLKKQMVVSPLSSSAETHRKEVPKLKIELPSLKTKITIPKPDSEKSPRSVHSSSTSSSAATSPTTSSSASGKSPMWLKPDDGVKSVDVPSIDIEEYAKTIGLKPVHKISSSEGGQKKKKKSSTSSSPDPSFHRKRKKAKHSKESGGKRRKLHAEISSQHDESLKMKVKLTEKPSKHERKPSEEITPQSPKEPTKHNTEVTPSSSLPAPPAPPPSALPLASPVAAATTMLTPPKEDSSKVIDITKGDDDDDVKIIEQPTLDVWPMAPANVTEKSTTVATRVNELPNLPSLCGSDSSTKAKINEMRAIRHKPMVYIPNLDKNLSDNSPTINNLIQSVQAKTGFIDKDNDVQIVSTSRLDGNALSLSKVPMPPLVPTKPISTVPSMKPPTVIPSTASGRMVSTNSIPKPQQRVTAQSQQVFSPRHTPSYPPLALQSAPKKVITPTTSNSTNVYQPRNVNPSLKRSISVDSNSTNNVPPKTPRVDLMELNSQNQFLKKPIYAPMFNFVKGASLAKNGNPNRLPTSANDVPYKSPISSSYTKEMSTKKPVPSLLLPPSSISVTKMTDTVPQPIPVDNRPALEIVRIPSTAPVADKPQTSPKSTSVTSKACRPPPPTIPLIKIKKSASVPEQPTSPISPSVFQVTSSSTNNSSKLSTTCASRQDTGGALDLTTRANDDLIILEGSDSLTPKLNGNETKPKTNAEKRPDIDSSRLELINSLIQTSAASMIKAGSGVMAKLQSSIPGLKLPPEMIGFAITSSSNVMPKLTVSSPSSGSTMTTTTAAKSIPMPKLAEINRNRNTAVRQLNPSVRSIPNPSALAFRNQTIAISSSSVTPAATSFASAVASVPSGGSTITSFSPTSPTTAARIMNVNMKTNNAANAATLAGQKSSVNNNGIGSVADTIPSIVSLAKTNTSTYGMGKSTTTSNGNGGASNAVSNLNGSGKNDNVSSTSNGGSGGSGSGGLGKKTIEKVAAGLKAAADAAAVVANGNRVSSSISSSNGNTGTGVGGGVSKNGVNVA